MAIRVVADGPRRGLARGTWRHVRLLLGGILVPSALLASVFVAVLVVHEVADQLDVPFIPADYVQAAKGLLPPALVVALVGLPLGVVLLRGRRRLVLFLRRFGYTEASMVVTHAACAVGHSWRLVTLDDAEIKPVSVGSAGVYNALARTGDRANSALDAVVRVLERTRTVLVVATAGVGVVAFVRHGSVAAVLESLDAPDVRLLLVLAVALVAILAVQLVWGLLGVVSLAVAPLIVPVMFFDSMTSAIRAADRAKAVLVRDLRGLELTARTVAELSRKVFAPRLVVVRVRTAIWQQAVSRLATAATIVLIDLSEPTENVLWEVEELIRQPDARCVFICHHHKLGPLVADASPGPTVARLRALLSNRRILTYAVDRRGRKRFTRALRATLEHESGR